MQFIGIDRWTVAINSVVTGSIKSADFDKLLIFLDQTSDANNIDATDLALVQVLIVYKRNDSAGYKEDYIVKSDLYSLMKMTNYQGGVGYLSADKTQMQAILDIGHVSVRPGEEVTITIQTGALGTIGGTPVLSVCGIKTDQPRQDLRMYESFTSAGDTIFKGCIELYETSADGNNIIIVQDGNNQLTVNDTVSSHLANAVGQYEAYEQFAVLWTDPTGKGKDIAVKSPANTAFLAMRKL